MSGKVSECEAKVESVFKALFLILKLEKMVENYQVGCVVLSWWYAMNDNGSSNSVFIQIFFFFRNENINCCFINHNFLLETISSVKWAQLLTHFHLFNCLFASLVKRSLLFPFKLYLLIHPFSKYVLTLSDYSLKWTGFDKGFDYGWTVCCVHESIISNKGL